MIGTSSGAAQARGSAGSAAAFFNLSPLHHPLWWLGLVVLIINDNLLKGAGVAPAWLTGKLSDFAFLIVAPVLVACLLPARLQGRRIFAFSAVSVVFVAADLDPSVSDGVVTLAKRLGLAWRLWPDVTDLLALAMLPLAWRISAGKATPANWRGAVWMQRLGVTVGALACIATSAPPEWQHYPYFVNDTAVPQTVTFRWILRKVDCGVDLAPVVASLDPSDLGKANQASLTAGQQAALDEKPADGAAIGGVCQNRKWSNPSGTAECSAVLVSVQGGPSALIAAQSEWDESDMGKSWFSCEESAKASDCGTGQQAGSADALTLKREGSGLVLRAGAKLKYAAVDLAELMARPESKTSCSSLAEQLRALVPSMTTGCVSDADCKILSSDLALPGDNLCVVYANRSASRAAFDNLAEQWSWSCQPEAAGGCAQGTYGTSQPPVCRLDACGPICPDDALEACPPSCASLGLDPNGTCTSYNGSPDCLSPDGQRCHCARQWDPRVCTPLTPPSPRCPIACIPTATLDGGTVVGATGGAPFDSGSADGRADVRSGADTIGDSPRDTATAPDASDGGP
jgi:hypothetical protein